MNFDIIGDIKEIVTIAKGAGIREIDRLRKTYGPGNWRKMKGIVRIRLSSGRIRLAELHWYEAHGIGKKEMKRKKYLDWDMKKAKEYTPNFVVCINNDNYPASLELYKIYRVIPDENAGAEGDIRIIDESGEDYLYPASYFASIRVPQVVEELLL